MRPKRDIGAKDFIFDIRAGMSDLQLMERYKLTARGFQSALQKLVDVQAISAEELYEKYPLYESTLSIEEMKRIVREPLTYPVPVREADYQEVEGTVRDITEKGVCIRGIQTLLGETKTFIIDAREFVDVGPFVFRAQCRWVKKSFGGEYTAGYEIVGISEKHLASLRKFIRYIIMDE